MSMLCSDGFVIGGDAGLPLSDKWSLRGQISIIVHVKGRRRARSYPESVCAVMLP